MIRGKIIVVGEEQSGVSKSGKAWRKRQYVLETEGQYVKKIAFNVLNDRIDQGNLQLGNVAEIEIDAESREWQGKWYTDLTAWKINNLGLAQPQQYAQQPVYQQQAPQGYVPAQPVQAAQPQQYAQQPVYQQQAPQSSDMDLPF